MKNLYASKPSSKSNDFKMTPTISNIDSNLLSIIINFNGYKINYTYIYIVRVSIRVLTDIRTSINIIGLIAKLNEWKCRWCTKRIRIIGKKEPFSSKSWNKISREITGTIFYVAETRQTLRFTLSRSSTWRLY